MEKRAVKQGVVSVVPVNCKEQEDLFFASDCKENPVFQYSTKGVWRLLDSYTVSEEYLKEARSILDNCLAEFGSEDAFMQREGGALLTMEETQDAFDCYIKEMQLEGAVSLAFSEGAIAPSTIYHNAHSEKSRMVASLPLVYRQNRMRGILHHEIGTHLVRTYNERQQIWSHKRKLYKLTKSLETEEGFASLQTNLDACSPGRRPYLWRSALHYFSCCHAAKLSFVGLFNLLEKYIADPKRRFKQVLRVKRGMKDTALPGGYYKDQAYLSGGLKILQQRRNIDFLVLISGKLSLEDHFRPEIRRRVKTQGILIPPYLRSVPEYLMRLEILASVNGID